MCLATSALLLLITSVLLAVINDYHNSLRVWCMWCRIRVCDVYPNDALYTFFGCTIHPPFLTGPCSSYWSDKASASLPTYYREHCGGKNCGEGRDEASS